MGRMIDGLTIGGLAERCGVTRDTVRFYEREGLLPRPRGTASQYRVYGAADESRLCFIRQAQRLGLTLDDIRELLRQHELRTPDECRRLASNLDRCQRARANTCPVVLDLAGDPVSRKETTS